MLSFDCIQNLLGLSNIIVKNITHTETAIEILLELPRQTHTCPCCGAATDSIHDYRLQTIKDIPSFGKHTYLILRKRRYVCEKCSKRFYEKVEFLPRYHRHTTRLAFYILKLLTSTHSFKSIAELSNLSVSTVIRIFDLLSYKPTKLPEVMGIDEFRGNTGHEKYQCIITDLQTKQVVDILPNRYKDALTSYFLQFDSDHTTLFVSDMWSTYRDLSYELFPRATYVVDKYHYARQVLWAFEAVRKEVQKAFTHEKRKYFKRSRTLLIKHFNDLTDDQRRQVNTMIYMSDDLAEAYFLKESFYTFMESKDYNTAKERLQNWINYASKSNFPRFISVAQTMINWQKGILNSFTTPYTNGFTEGANNKIKVLKRNAYGYRNFNRFRNRILHIFNHIKKETV